MYDFVKHNAVLWLIPAFIVSSLAVGLPYWQIPYAKVSLPNTLFGPGLLLVGIVAIAVRAFGKAHFLLAFLIVGAAVPAAVLVRVAVETTQDPTSHNLWPIEIVIAGMVGLACSLLGTLIGSIPALLSKKTSRA